MSILLVLFSTLPDMKVNGVQTDVKFLTKSKHHWSIWILHYYKSSGAILM